ncbi:MAG TPA: hypothetical protein VKY19_08415 [Ktedonosporobacter sp.]|nr:hypothetical protein [Ktedonosporobacter sp.]
MSTYKHDTETEQKDLLQRSDAPPPDSIYTEDTMHEQRIPSVPPPSPPPPPLHVQPPRPRNNPWTIATIVAVIVVVLLTSGLVVFAQLNAHPNPNGTATPAPTVTSLPTTVPGTPPPSGSDVTPLPTPGVTFGPQACPSAVKDPAYWNTIIGAKAGVSLVESVSCANVLGNTSLQALVTARHSGTGATLDAYVFDKITSATPKQLFKLQGLSKGDAKISYYNTILTAEVDQNSGINAGKPDAQLTPDLFREFAWDAGQQALVQVAFPGIFPDLTRYQAEAAQAQVNHGLDTWKNDPVQVAQRLASRFLNWTRPATGTLVSGGGAQDVYATVRVVESTTVNNNPTIIVTLSRLEGSTHNYWVVIAVEDTTLLSVASPQARTLIASPVTIEGQGSAFEAVIGKAMVLDHLYTDIGHATVTASQVGMGKGPFSTRVIYNTTFHNGVQEGIVEVQEANGGISDEPATAVMRKVLLDPEPGVALGSLPCPDKVQDPAYWNPIVGAQAGVSRVTQISCANMKGDPSLQALVTVFYENSSTVRDIYVYDRITDAKPVQLFKLTGLTNAGAAISAYSTIMTAEVDPNSSINKGATQMTQDLFREFKWNAGKGSFVQVAFPGIFPDLTRWQAENDQRAVNNGQDAWKNDAAKVALNAAVKFLQWLPTAQTKILSGGSAQDVDAVVQVQNPRVHVGPFITRVTLSRLEGNIHNMWVAIALQSDSIAITSPQKNALITSPATVAGNGTPLFENQIGVVHILDHLYTDIGYGFAMGDKPTMPPTPTTFTVQIRYNASFHGGTQEGVIALYSSTPVDGSIVSDVVMKVLISG